MLISQKEVLKMENVNFNLSRVSDIVLTTKFIGILVVLLLFAFGATRQDAITKIIRLKEKVANLISRNNIAEAGKVLNQIIAESNKIIESNPNLIDGYTSRAFAYNQLFIVTGESKYLDLAEKDLSNAIKISPNDSYLYINLADLERYRLNFKKAIKYVKKAVELEKIPFNYGYLGFNILVLAQHNMMHGENSLNITNELLEAINAYNEAIRLNPNYFSAIGERGICFYFLGEYDRAEKDLKAAIAMCRKLGYPQAAAQYIEVLNEIKH